MFVCLFVLPAFGLRKSQCNQTLHGIPFHPGEGQDGVGSLPHPAPEELRRFSPCVFLKIDGIFVRFLSKGRSKWGSALPRKGASEKVLPQFLKVDEILENFLGFLECPPSSFTSARCLRMKSYFSIKIELSRAKPGTSASDS
jgi:hypothetical protein